MVFKLRSGSSTGLGGSQNRTGWLFPSGIIIYSVLSFFIEIDRTLPVQIPDFWTRASGKCWYRISGMIGTAFPVKWYRIMFTAKTQSLSEAIVILHNDANIE